MCGIAGIVDRRSCSQLALDIKKMTEALFHRGPDGEGIYVDRECALGHRRLSIIDIEGGAQPLCNEDKQLWVTFNGEIYNYIELHRVLEQRGHRFRTRSDTEVIVHAYEEWGADCVKHFRGMFAFAIHDQRTREVFLARDRLGIKPFFYLVETDRIAFASEIHALEKLSDLKLRINHSAIDQFLQMGYISAPATIFRDLYKLPPGHTARIGCDGKLIGPFRYWDVDFRPDENKTEDEWLEQLEHTIREAIRIHLRSDVSFGAFLSGGVDSSLVVGYMSRLLSEPVRTFSIGFEEADFSELRFARNAAEVCRTHHHEQVLKPNALDILPALVRHYGEPFGDSSAIPTYYVSKLAKQHVKMVLSGDGGDESFAGYFQHKIAAGYRRSSTSFRADIKRTLKAAARAVGLQRPKDLWIDTVALLPKKDRKRLYRNGLLAAGRTPKTLQSHYHHSRRLDLCSWFQYLDLKNYLPDDILTKVDIATMFHGLEARVPLLDHHVVELAGRIPLRFKLKRSGPNDFTGKYILKRLARQFYKDDFLNRPKMGFAVPLTQWLSSSSEQEIAERLADDQGRLSELFNPSALSESIRLRNQHWLHASRLWNLLFLAEWFRQHPAATLT